MIDGVGDLVTAVRRASARWPDRPAWTFDPGERLTFAEVEARSAGYATALRARGVGAGDRIAVLLRNQAEFPLTWLALARLGAVLVPVNVRYRSTDAEHVLRTANVTGIVTTPEFGPSLSSLPRAPTVHHVADLEAPRSGGDYRPDPQDTVSVQFTSGTTGRPKGCVLSHRYWTTLAGGLVADFPRLTDSDVMLTAQSFHYLDPQWNVVAALLAGAELVVLDGFHPATLWSKLRQHRVTYFYCLGAMPNLLLAMPPDPLDREHRVRVVQCSAIPPHRHAELERRWGVGWYEAFGMTETGGDIRVTERDHDGLVGTGCLGTAAAHREVRIVDEHGRPVPAGARGQILLRGPGMMDGYLDDEQATAAAFQDGWFHTGDIGRMDEAGRVYHLGRIKDMIRRGGENVAAQEVEAVLLSHPAVSLAAVVGIPDELRGEEVKAYCVTDGGTPEDLAAYCGERLAAFKVPRYWEFREELPRTDSHRIAKSELAQTGGPVYDRATGRWATS